MTRANFHLITRQGTFKFQSNSSAYPDYMMGDVLNLIAECASSNAVFEGEIGFYEPDSSALSTLVSECGLTLGSIGNFSYHYEINFVTNTVKVWESKRKWVNAPADWEAKGWQGCYDNGKGKFGYHGVAKGKKIYDKKFSQLIEPKPDCEPNFVRYQPKASEVEAAKKCVD